MFIPFVFERAGALVVQAFLKSVSHYLISVLELSGKVTVAW